MMHPCYVEDGSIINAHSGAIIEDPAVLVDRETGTLHGWGQSKTVKAKFEKFIALARCNDPDTRSVITGSLMFIELDGYHISREDACYVMRRMIEFTATGFIEAFCDRLFDGSDLAAWLHDEKERIPIDIYEKEWKRR